MRPEGYSSHPVCVSFIHSFIHSTKDLEDDGLPGSETM